MQGKEQTLKSHKDWAFFPGISNPEQGIVWNLCQKTQIKERLNTQRFVFQIKEVWR